MITPNIWKVVFGKKRIVSLGMFGIWRKGLRKVLIIVMRLSLAGLLIIIFAFPLYWVVASSLKSPSELYKLPLVWFPTKLYFVNYLRVLTRTQFPVALKNSIIVAALTVTFGLMLSSSGAYAISRLRIRGRKTILQLFLTISLLPGIATLSPIYRIFSKLHLLNTYLALILTYTAGGLSFSIWYLTNFFKTIPVDLEEAAMIDGCSMFRAYYKIILPLSLPGLVSIGILMFLGAWNEFLFALVLTQTYATRTAPVALSLLPVVEYEIPWGAICAASSFMTLPMVLLALICQRWIIGGLTTGAIKG